MMQRYWAGFSPAPKWIGWRERFTVETRPQRGIVGGLALPSRCAGYMLLQCTRDSQLLFERLPAELFSEISFAQPRFVVQPASRVRLEVVAPPRPPSPHWSMWRAASPNRRDGLWWRASRPRWMPAPRPERFAAAITGSAL